MRCHTHGRGFTVYPPGHFPYGRTPLAPVTADGRWVMGSEAVGAQRFQGTLFDAALDACRGRAWPKESYDGDPKPRFPTQLRHLNRTASLLSVHPRVGSGERETAAAILPVPGQVLHDGAALIECQPHYRNWGQAICCVLDALAGGPFLFERLAECGARVGLWPLPQIWEAGQVRRPTFRNLRTRAPPAS